MVTLRVDVDGEIHDYVKNEAVKFDFQILSSAHITTYIQEIPS